MTEIRFHAEMGGWFGPKNTSAILYMKAREGANENCVLFSEAQLKYEKNFA